MCTCVCCAYMYVCVHVYVHVRTYIQFCSKLGNIHVVYIYVQVPAVQVHEFHDKSHDYHMTHELFTSSTFPFISSILPLKYKNCADWKKKRTEIGKSVQRYFLMLPPSVVTYIVLNGDLYKRISKSWISFSAGLNTSRVQWYVHKDGAIEDTHTCNDPCRTCSIRAVSTWWADTVTYVKQWLRQSSVMLLELLLWGNRTLCVCSPSINIHVCNFLFAMYAYV